MCSHHGAPAVHTDGPASADLNLHAHAQTASICSTPPNENANCHLVAATASKSSGFRVGLRVERVGAQPAHSRAAAHACMASGRMCRHVHVARAALLKPCGAPCTPERTVRTPCAQRPSYAQGVQHPGAGGRIPGAAGQRAQRARRRSRPRPHHRAVHDAAPGARSSRRCGVRRQPARRAHTGRLVPHTQTSLSSASSRHAPGVPGLRAACRSSRAALGLAPLGLARPGDRTERRRRMRRYRPLTRGALSCS